MLHTTTSVSTPRYLRHANSRRALNATIRVCPSVQSLVNTRTEANGYTDDADTQTNVTSHVPSTRVSRLVPCNLDWTVDIF